MECSTELLERAGYVVVPYGQWDYARMELALGSKVCILATREQAAAARDKAPIPIGSDRNGAVVRVKGEDPYSDWHSKLFTILRGGYL